MAGGSNHPPIIIKKVVKKGGGGHHGGAWKVAYADFVTAMMAFFLLLWLLNATTEDQKQAISNYFAPASVSMTKSGAGGVLGGKTFAEGPMPYNGGAPGVIMMLPPPGGPGDPDAEESEAEGERDVGDADAKEGVGDKKRSLHDKAALETVAAAQEKQQFEQASTALRQAIQASPELEPLAASLVIDQTSEGLRIQIVDQDRVEMFSRGSSILYPHTRDLLRKVAAAIRVLPHKVAVTGYTDSSPYASDRSYSNWELSSDRANASRRALIEAGLPADNVTRVVGRADTDLLVPDDPTSPRNRRISITLLRKAAAATAVQ